MSTRSKLSEMRVSGHPGNLHVEDFGHRLGPARLAVSPRSVRRSARFLTVASNPTRAKTKRSFDRHPPSQRLAHPMASPGQNTAPCAQCKVKTPDSPLSLFSYAALLTQ